jgi:adenylylsulfate kinase-like enzyme
MQQKTAPAESGNASSVTGGAAPSSSRGSFETMGESPGRVVWITGLSGAGKSTLAETTAQLLRAQGKRVICLDGDDLRDVFGAVEASPEHHGRQARLTLALQYARLCRVLALQNLTVIIATISLFREVHRWNRQNLPNYFEVYLKVPLDELRRRDPKGIYRRFDAGLLTDVAGLDLPVDEPSASDLTVEFVPGQQVQDLAATLIRTLNEWRTL